MDYYKVLLGKKFSDSSIYYGLLFWSPIYRDVDYLVADCPSEMLCGGEDQLNDEFTFAEAKDHIERLKLHEKYEVVEIIKPAATLKTNKGEKAQLTMEQQLNQEVSWTD